MYPVYFSTYYNPPIDTSLNAIYNCYDGRYPLLDLTIENGRIELTLRIDAVSGYLLKYSYLEKNKNWYFTDFKEWMETDAGTRQYTDKAVLPKAETIDEFSFEKYLCPNLLNSK